MRATFRECEHEPDVLTAVYTNRWPDKIDADLRAHVETCPTCADALVVVAAFERESDASRVAVPVPDASVVWWRSQLRARNEAARTAMRPITIAQAVGLAVAVGVGGAIFGATATWFQRSLGSVGGALTSLFHVDWPARADIVAALATYGVWVAAIAVIALVTPVAVYLVVRED